MTSAKPAAPRLKIPVGALVWYAATSGGSPVLLPGKVEEVHKEGRVLVAYTLKVANHGWKSRDFRLIRVSAARVTPREYGLS